MFKKNTDEDVSETEYNTVIKPHIDKVNSFHETYLVPEISAYYIATGYYNNALYKDSLLNHITSCTSTIDMRVLSKKTCLYIETSFIHSNLCGVRIISSWWRIRDSNP